VLDFATGKERKVQVEEGECIQPLGFVMGDFVYGVARKSDAGKTVTGEDVLGMYRVEIRDEKNQVVKTYQTEGVYILGAGFETNRITLQCAVKENGLYRQTADEYIANNEEKKGTVSLQPYQSELKGTEYCLSFAEGFKKEKARVLRPKQMLAERDTTLKFEEKSEKLYYSAYGQGELLAVYEEAGEALRAAKKAFGVVISPRQRYVWEDGNRVAWYRNFEVPAVVAGDGESTLAASLRTVAGYEGKQVDVSMELQGKNMLEVLEMASGGEAVRLRACSSADMRYLLDKGTPVIALTGSAEAVVLVGYDAKTVTYMNPANGGTRTLSFDAFDAMVEGSGRTFLGYMRDNDKRESEHE
ncbi:MAG: hypothetical protein UHS49_03500, partial [Faecalimonas sp.]|nr:hypothetical protein [Faecalimonas sp.]